MAVPGLRAGVFVELSLWTLELIAEWERVQGDLEYSNSLETWSVPWAGV